MSEVCYHNPRRRSGLTGISYGKLNIHEVMDCCGPKLMTIPKTDFDMGANKDM